MQSREPLRHTIYFVPGEKLKFTYTPTSQIIGAILPAFRWIPRPFLSLGPRAEHPIDFGEPTLTAVAAVIGANFAFCNSSQANGHRPAHRFDSVTPRCLSPTMGGHRLIMLRRGVPKKWLSTPPPPKRWLRPQVYPQNCRIAIARKHVLTRAPKVPGGSARTGHPGCTLFHKVCFGSCKGPHCGVAPTGHALAAEGKCLPRTTAAW